MTRLRLVCAAGALLLVLTGTTAAVLSALPLDLPALGSQTGATTFEVRLAELQPGAGLAEAVVEGSDQRLYLRSTAVVTGADVTGAQVVDAGGRFSINVAFTPAAGAAAPAPAQRYKGDDPGVALPKVLTEVKPGYTPAAMQAMIQGVVELSIVVRADGSVSDVVVTQSLDTTYGLDAAAVEAARQWTFNPGTKDGRAVDVQLTLNFKFRLG